MESKNLTIAAIASLGVAAVVHSRVTTKKAPPIKQVFAIGAVGLSMFIIDDLSDNLGRDVAGLILIVSLIHSGDEVFREINKGTVSKATWPSIAHAKGAGTISFTPTGQTNATLLSLTSSGNTPSAAGVVAPNPNAAKAVQAAYSQIGLPYRTANPGIPGVGWNCSSLTGWCWGQAGHSLPALAVTQYELTSHVPYANALPGDLVFYHGAVPKGPERIGHVGMYIGGGKQIDAPGHGTTIQVRNVYSDHFPLVGRVH